jgi:predicted methyltransferase
MNLRNAAAAVTVAAFATFSAVSLAATGKKDAQAIESAVSGSWRSADSKERDTQRHPVDALEFWGLKPGATILEVQPGGGWWTEILAPYARATQGEFYATPGNDAFKSKFTDEKVYGKVNQVAWGKDAAPLPANKFDFVLLARGLHGWVRQGTADKNLADIFQATKPGGVLAVEQHRAKAGQDPAVFNGYLDEAYVISLVEKAGFKLAGKSEINANPKDTKDHPFGVWTLPPTRQSSEGGKPVDASFDRARYDAIGESDRMTLRFEKPKK